MNQPTPPETPKSSPSPSPRPRRRLLFWFLGGSAIAGVGWVGFWAVLQNVAQPFIEQQVSNTLERPVEMGRVTKVTINQIHFGPTRLPTQPDDSDHAIAQAVEVQFTPLKIALQRRLELDITLKDSNAYIEEDEDGQWLHLPEFKEGNLPIKIRVTAIRIRNAALDAVKRSFESEDGEETSSLLAPLQLQVDQGDLYIQDEDGVNTIEVRRLRGEFVEGGGFGVDGTIAIADGSIDGLSGKMAVRAKQVNLAELARLLPPLPVELSQGRASANITIALDGNPLNLDTLPMFKGIASIEDIVVGTPDIPAIKPQVTVEKGDIRLNGRVASLDGWRTKFGEIPVRIGGQLSADDERLNNVMVNLPPTKISTLLETLEFEDLVPVPVSGAIALAANLSGSIEDPKLTARVVDACVKEELCDSLRVDRVPFKELAVDVAVDVKNQDLLLKQAILEPRSGGRIVAKGDVSLKDEVPAGVLSATFANLSADALLATYDVPLPIRVGRLSGQAQAYVPLEDWQKLKATVTAQVLDGTVTIGNVALQQKLWSGTVAAQNLRVPDPLPVERANARLKVGGRLDSFELDTFTASGIAQAQLAQGQITASRIDLRNGQFSTVVEAQSAEVGAIAANYLPEPLQDIPIGALDGQLAVTGRLRGGNLPDLVGTGAIAIGLAGGVAALQNVRLQNNQLTAQAGAQGLRLATVRSLVPTQVPLEAYQAGVASATVDVATNITPLLKGDIDALLEQTTLKTDATVRGLLGGQAQVVANLAQNRVTAQVQTQGTRLVTARSLVPTQIPLEAYQSGIADATVDVATNLPPLLKGDIDGLLAQTTLKTDATVQGLLGGQAQVVANLTQNQLTADIQTQGTKLATARSLVPAQIPANLYDQGIANADINIKTSLTPLLQGDIDTLLARTTLETDATVRGLLDGQGQAVVNLRLQDNQITAQTQAQNIQLAAARSLIPTDLPLESLALGIANADIEATTSLTPILKGDVTALLAQTDLTMDATVRGLLGGQSQAEIKLRNNRLDAQVDSQGVQLAAIQPFLPTGVPINTQELGVADTTVDVQTNLNPLLQGNLTALLDQTTLKTDATVRGLSGGQGRAIATLNQGQWSADLKGKSLYPTRLVPLLPETLDDPVSGEFQLAGLVPDRLDLASLNLTGKGRAQITQGEVELPEIRLANNQLTARAIPSAIALHPFHPLLRGQLTGDVTVDVPLNQPTALTANGAVNLNKGVSLVTNPLDVAFAWGNERLTVERLHAPNQLDVAGHIDVDLDRILAGAIGPNVVEQVDLKVDARSLAIQQGVRDLQQLIALPAIAQSISIGGTAGFVGTVQGNLAAPRVDGAVTLGDLALNRWALDPLITGPVTLNANGATVDLTGDRDRIQLALDSGYLPTGFDIQLQDLTATGTRRGNLLTAEVANVSLRRLKRAVPASLLPPTIAAQPLAGKLDGDFEVNLKTFAVAGNIDVTRPVAGPLHAESFTTGVQLSIADGAIALQNAQLTTGNTRYLVDGSLGFLQPGLPVNGQLKIEDGNLRDVFAALQLTKFSEVLQLTKTFTSPAIGNAADLRTVPVGDSGLTLGEQLDRLSEILALNTQSQEGSIDSVPLPGLTTVQGDFEGQVTLQGSLTEGLAGLRGKVDIAGDTWEWGNYIADRVTLKGDLQDGEITVQPFELQSGEGAILLSGIFSVDDLTGQVQIKDFPIVTLQDLVPLPPAIGFGGEVNATATISGDRANPQMTGRITLDGANINDTAIETATASFSYNNAILRFGGKSVLSESGTPLTLTGRLPYQLPIPGTTPPEDYNLEATANVKDDGLQILNLITRQQLAWQSGQADVNVQVNGSLNPETNRLESLIATGEVQLADGVVAAALLPDEPLTDLNGRILLNFDQIDVEQLTGQFGGGAIALAGSLPTFQNRPQDNPLTLQMSQLNVQRKGLFEGSIDGLIRVLGTALAPQVTGDVGVSDGEVLLLGVAQASSAAAASGDGSGGGVASLVTFQDFKITLVNDFVLKQFPLLEFAAQGNLVVNGSFPNLEPDGEIDLTRGYLNLFTSNFRLDSEYRSQALLSPVTGLDPYLDMQLIGSVIESSRQALAVETNNGEIADRSRTVSSVQSLEVIAEVQASALELIETLNSSRQTGLSPNNPLISLSSSPRRSETEILALMGGSFVNSIAGGDSNALVGGLADIAGNALFGNFQRDVQSALGLSEFRVFPTQVIETDDEETSSASTLGVAVELGKKVGDRATISILRFLTPENQPTRYNVRYRINDNFTLRGSTDLQGDQRAVIEYEVRF